MDIDEEILKWENEFKRGFSKPFILLTLNEKPNYPYQILKKINRNTKGKISIAGSNIYPILSNLEEFGLINSEKEKESQKKFYSLTVEGKEFLKVLKLVMNEFVEIIESMINSKEGE